MIGATDQLSEASSKEGELYLNNALLTAGHAVLKRAWQFKDWEPDL